MKAVLTITAAAIVSASLNVAMIRPVAEAPTVSHYSTVELAELASQATVVIATVDAQASGFAISPDGLIVTNSHAIRATDNRVMLLSDDGEYVAYPAAVVINDPVSDLAILHIEAPTPHFLRLGRRFGTLKRGQLAAVMSAPYGFSGTFSTGVISSIRPDMNKPQRIQTTAAVSPGSSGSALLNEDGEVVGIITSIYTQQFAQAINMAVSVNELYLLLDKTKKYSLIE